MLIHITKPPDVADLANIVGEISQAAIAQLSKDLQDNLNAFHAGAPIFDSGSEGLIPARIVGKTTCTVLFAKDSPHDAMMLIMISMVGDLPQIVGGAFSFIPVSMVVIPKPGRHASVTLEPGEEQPPIMKWAQEWLGDQDDPDSNMTVFGDLSLSAFEDAVLDEPGESGLAYGHAMGRGELRNGQSVGVVASLIGELMRPDLKNQAAAMIKSFRAQRAFGGKPILN